MRIAIVVAGTRGDVQPALALANRLQRLGHQVHMAAHEPYRPLVTQAGVPFYPLGGDPVALTKVAVDARGMLPCSIQSFMTVRREYRALIDSTLDACMGPRAPHGKGQDPPQAVRPDLIISTPITHGVPHVAEALGVPLHIVSAVPWSPSKVLAHPWARAFDLSWSEITEITLAKILPIPRTLPTQGPLPRVALDQEPAVEQHKSLHSPLEQNIQLVSTCPKSRAGGRSGWVPRWYLGARSWVHDCTMHQMSWWSTVMLDMMVVSGVVDMLVGLRLRLGLAPWGQAWNLYKHPHTFTFSRHLVPRPADWPSHMTISGPLLLDPAGQPAPHPSDRLLSAHSFLDDLLPELSITSTNDLAFLSSLHNTRNSFTLEHASSRGIHHATRSPALDSAWSGGMEGWLDEPRPSRPSLSLPARNLALQPNPNSSVTANNTPEIFEQALGTNISAAATPSPAASPFAEACGRPTAAVEAHGQQTALHKAGKAGPHQSPRATLNQSSKAIPGQCSSAVSGQAGDGRRSFQGPVGWADAPAGPNERHGWAAEPAGADVRQPWMTTSAAVEGDHRALPPALERFLDAGDPPVYVGFGSCSAQLCSGTSLAVGVTLAALATGTRLVVNRAMWMGRSEDWDQFAAEVRSAAQGMVPGLASPAGAVPVRPEMAAHVPGSDLHVALVEGGSAATGDRLQGMLYLVDEMPHDYLLPRCSGVVHHGGAGTLQAGLLAGCPTLVCPVYGDQFFWGEVACSVGAGPPPLPAYLLNAQALAQAFQELRRLEYVDQAAELSQLMRTEAAHSLDVAVEHILKHLAAAHTGMSTAETPTLPPGPSKTISDTPQPTTSTGPAEQAPPSLKDRREPGGGDSWASVLLRGARLRLCRFWY